MDLDFSDLIWMNCLWYFRTDMTCTWCDSSTPLLSRIISLPPTPLIRINQPVAYCITSLFQFNPPPSPTSHQQKQCCYLQMAVNGRGGVRVMASWLATSLLSACPSSLEVSAVGVTMLTSQHRWHVRPKTDSIANYAHNTTHTKTTLKQSVVVSRTNTRALNKPKKWSDF